MLISFFFLRLQAIITVLRTRMGRMLDSSLRKAVFRWRMTSPAPDQLPSQLSQLKTSQQFKRVVQAVLVKAGQKASKRQEVGLKLHDPFLPFGFGHSCGMEPTASVFAVHFLLFFSPLRCCRSFLLYWLFVFNLWLWPFSV